MRMKWLAAGFVLGGIVGAMTPVIAQVSSMLTHGSYFGVAPNGWVMLGCVTANGQDRTTGVRISSSSGPRAYQLIVSCD